MSDARTALATLRQAADDGSLDPIMERNGVRVFGAFGSATLAGDHTPSDLDVGVQFKDRLKVLELLDELTELTRYDRIDLTVIDGEHPVSDAEAMTGFPLYEAEPGAYATLQMAALAHRRDTEWLRLLDLQRMAE
ncbi:MAG: hypothetical protein V9F03_08175 [Microthrixaceae bacterium]